MGTEKSILIVDKSATFCSFLGLLLRRFGLNPVTSSSRHEAREKALTMNLGLVVIGEFDDNYPQSVFLQGLRADPLTSHLPTVIVSRGGDKDEERACKAAGACIVHKPVSPTELHEAVYSLIVFPSGQRKDVRCEMNIPAKLFLNGILVPSNLISLSRGGAMASSPGNYPPGTILSVEVPLVGDDVFLEGTVIYNRKAHHGMRAVGCGVQFHRDVVHIHGRDIQSTVDSHLVTGLNSGALQ